MSYKANHKRGNCRKINRKVFHVLIIYHNASKLRERERLLAIKLIHFSGKIVRVIIALSLLGETRFEMTFLVVGVCMG